MTPIQYQQEASPWPCITVHCIPILERSWEHVVNNTGWKQCSVLLVADCLWFSKKCVYWTESRHKSSSRERWWSGNSLFCPPHHWGCSYASAICAGYSCWFLSLTFCKGLVETQTCMSLQALSKVVCSRSYKVGATLFSVELQTKKEIKGWCFMSALETPLSHWYSGIKRSAGRWFLHLTSQIPRVPPSL